MLYLNILCKYKGSLRRKEFFWPVSNDLITTSFSLLFLSILAHGHCFPHCSLSLTIVAATRLSKNCNIMILMHARLIDHKVNILNMHLNTILDQTSKYSNNPNNDQTLILNLTKCDLFCTDCCFV